MEGGRATTPICNPLMGTVRFFGVQWGTGIYWGTREGEGTGGYCRVLEALWGYWGYLGVIVSTGGYSGLLQVLGVLRGNWGTLGYCRYCGVLSGTGVNWGCWWVLRVQGILG